MINDIPQEMFYTAAFTALGFGEPVNYDVLVTDDDDDVRGFITDALDFEGYATWSLPTHALTIEIVKEVAPNLIILELQPTTFAAIDSFFTHLAQDAETNSISILLTATDRHVLRNVMSSTSSSQYRSLLKPFELTELFGVVKCLVGQRHSGYSDSLPSPR